MTTGKCLSSHALIKNELWLDKRKNPTSGLVVVWFGVFSYDAENKVLMWRLEIYLGYSQEISWSFQHQKKSAPWVYLLAGYS